MMTEYQRTLVEENLDLLDRLILKHIGVSGRALQTYEDYYQIGSEALCRAAMQYDPSRGPFAPLGWRYAYNAIIDHCRKQQQVNQDVYKRQVIGQKVTGKNGTAIWTGLKSGTYILEEVDPADGLSLIHI